MDMDPRNIRALQSEAEDHGDTATVELCKRALLGDIDARKTCNVIISEAEQAALGDDDDDDDDYDEHSYGERYTRDRERWCAD